MTVKVNVILPNSPLFFGSGRSFSPNTSFWDVTLPLPTPSTLFGAFGRVVYESMGVTHCNSSCREEILNRVPKFIPAIAEIPSENLESLFYGKETEAHLYLPAPPVRKRGEAFLPPCKLGDLGDLAFNPTPTTWIPVTKLVCLLSGRMACVRVIRPEEVLTFEDRVGIKLGKQRVVEQGFFYRLTMVAPRVGEKSFFPAFISISNSESEEVVRDGMRVLIGGERRTAVIREVRVRGLEGLMDLITGDLTRNEYLLLTPGIYLERSECSFRDLYRGDSSKCCVRSRKSLLHGMRVMPAPKGFKSHVRGWSTLPLTLRHRWQERVVIRAVSEGSVLVRDGCDGCKPTSFGEEMGFGFVVPMEVPECFT